MLVRAHRLYGVDLRPSGSPGRVVVLRVKGRGRGSRARARSRPRPIHGQHEHCLSGFIDAETSAMLANPAALATGGGDPMAATRHARRCRGGRVVPCLRRRVGSPASRLRSAAATPAAEEPPGSSDLRQIRARRAGESWLPAWSGISDWIHLTRSWIQCTVRLPFPGFRRKQRRTWVDDTGRE